MGKKLEDRLNRLQWDKEDCMDNLKRCYAELAESAARYSKRAEDNNFTDVGHLRSPLESIVEYSARLKGINDQINLLMWIKS